MRTLLVVVAVGLAGALARADEGAPPAPVDPLAAARSALHDLREAWGRATPTGDRSVRVTHTYRVLLAGAVVHRDIAWVERAQEIEAGVERMERVYERFHDRAPEEDTPVSGVRIVVQRDRATGAWSYDVVEGSAPVPDRLERHLRRELGLVALSTARTFDLDRLRSAQLLPQPTHDPASAWSFDPTLLLQPLPNIDHDLDLAGSSGVGQLIAAERLASGTRYQVRLEASGPLLRVGVPAQCSGSAKATLSVDLPPQGAVERALVVTMAWKHQREGHAAEEGTYELDVTERREPCGP